MALKEKLAELIVDITTKLSPLKKQLAKANSMMKRSFASMVKLAKRGAIAIGAAFVAIGVAAIKMAANAQESESFFNESLGSMAKSTRKWSNELSKALGLNAFEVRKMVGTFNVMLKSMGFVEKEAAKTSQSLVELAFDMSSFNDISPEEAFNKLKAGIIGSSEPLAGLGIIINATTVRQHALNKGWITGTEKLTELQKVQGRYSLIMERTTAAQGDLLRTSGSLTNMWRRMIARLKVMGITIGTALIPMVTKLVTELVTLIETHEKAISDKFVQGYKKIGKSIAFLSKAVQSLRKHWVALVAVLAVGIFAKILIVTAAVVKALALLGTTMVATVAAIGAGVGFIIFQLREWFNTLNKIIEARRELGKKQTFDQRAAKAAATADERAIKRKKMLLALEKKRLEAAKKRAEAEVVAAKTEAGVASKTDEEKRIIKEAALEKLKALADFYKKAGGHEEELAALTKTIRLQEAGEIARKIGGDSLEIFNELEAAAERARLAALPKQAPIEAARVGLASFQAVWGQIATGTERVDKDQLRVLEKIAESTERSKELAEDDRGMQVTGTPRY